MSAAIWSGLGAPDIHEAPDSRAQTLRQRLRKSLAGALDAARLLSKIEHLSVARQMLGPAVRGLVLHPTLQNRSTLVPTRHGTLIDWTYRVDEPSAELYQLHQRAQRGQWMATDLAWDTGVDPEDPNALLLPDDFFDFRALAALGVRLDARERNRFRRSFVSWMIGQFLHGEQAALYAAAQVVEGMPSMAAKRMAATQVVDEARHVETFQRYLTSKLDGIYSVDENLLVVIDSILGDKRWDVKFIGMQIVVEGMALSAFGNLYKRTAEPLLKSLLRRILEDEARHVSFGLHTLRHHLSTLSEAERCEREEWALDATLLMRNRFYADEVFDEWFGSRFTRAKWRGLMDHSPGMNEFRQVMFGRVIRNLRDIGLLTERTRVRYSELCVMRDARH